MEHPEDQYDSLGLYSQPFSLLVSTFVAKLLHLFLFIAVIGSLSDKINLNTECAVAVF